MRRDVTTLPFPIVPPTREAQRILMCPGDPFDDCYEAAWSSLMDDYADLEAKHVEDVLRALDADGRGMAGQGAERLIRDRPGLHKAICEGLDNVLNPDKWLRDQAALDELMEDMG